MQMNAAQATRSPLQTIFERNRAGEQQGVVSVCSAHPQVIRAALELARDRDQVAVIEATCNQVNQHGGYTGMTPEQFAQGVRATAAEIGLPGDRLVLGGDHLGPQPWRALPAEAAMAQAIAMIEAYARAGYTKLHLDCSMACADDAEPLGDAVIAARAARMAHAAEAALDPDAARPVYIIGTEVPAPGGMGEGHAIVPTAPASVMTTWRVHDQAFADAGLGDVFARVVAIVVQPGLDFGNEDVVRFVPGDAADLAGTVSALGGAVFEAHSTDYQDADSFRALVQMHFAILKVGPAATFALREAIYALECIARELPGWDARFSVRTAVESAMLADPAHWISHYAGGPAQQRYLRHFSFSDRVRYYWTDLTVASAVAALTGFCDGLPLPLPLISQYLPQHAGAVADGTVAATADALCRAHVRLALAPYADACGVHARSDTVGAR
ncbi:class II D-tagatose-bisphosphate aldolase non-catalytic subunit [Novosphingobium sp.]|uniref:class II D-tagatose-bisphosphate aldolase non-catalytic subunit n=1 Tax=Novosphingobium sp. TaxID=1874826 RepID=UPI003B52D329